WSSAPPRRGRGRTSTSTSPTEPVDGPAVVVGTVAKAHGVRGEVAVEVRSDNPDRFADGATVYLEDGRALTVRSHRSHGDRLLVSFAGVDDRDAAAALRG